MKISSFILLAITLSVTTVLTTSCIKEQGCTYPDSINYSETAEIDDGSCFYEGSVVFWYGKTTSIGLMNDGATSLTYYFDGRIVGSSATNVYWAGAEGPDCGTTGSVTVDIDLGKHKTQAYSFSVIDQTGWEYYDGVINIHANSCIRKELGWSKKKRKKFKK